MAREISTLSLLCPTTFHSPSIFSITLGKPLPFFSLSDSSRPISRPFFFLLLPLLWFPSPLLRFFLSRLFPFPSPLLPLSSRHRSYNLIAHEILRLNSRSVNISFFFLLVSGVDSPSVAGHWVCLQFIVESKLLTLSCYRSELNSGWTLHWNKFRRKLRLTYVDVWMYNFLIVFFFSPLRRT